MKKIIGNLLGSYFWSRLQGLQACLLGLQQEEVQYLGLLQCVQPSCAAVISK
jgi:hypothetical protein